MYHCNSFPKSYYFYDLEFRGGSYEGVKAWRLTAFGKKEAKTSRTITFGHCDNFF
jgi:hypothetical protein